MRILALVSRPRETHAVAFVPQDLQNSSLENDDASARLEFRHSTTSPHTTMLDPVSSLSAPPPRYLLESDSSDEEGQGVYPSGQRKRATTTPAVSVKWLDEAVPATSVVVGLGQAGKYLARRANARMAVLSVDVDGHTVGTGFSLGDDLLVQLADSDEKGEAACGVVEQLTKLVSAQSW